jgi:hypothetical protein
MLDGRLVRAIFDAGEVISFRSLPFLVIFILQRRAPTSRKVAALALYGWSTLTIFSANWLLRIALTYAYLILAACGLRLLVLRSRQGGLARAGGAAHVVSVVLFLVLPGCLPGGALRSICVLLGWECLLSAYSYFYDCQKLDGTSWADYLFFLLVNPCLVYSTRGVSVLGEPGNLRGARRATWGFVAFLSAEIIFLPVVERSQHETSNFTSSSAYVVWFIVGAAMQFLILYARHSGLAHVQIGLMRQIGYIVPERYNWPMLARNPVDFWKRWNTYLGGWLLKYAFTPLALQWGRWTRGRGLPSALSQMGAILATFGVGGLLHDSYAYLAEGRLAFGWTAAFLSSSLFVILWIGLQRRWRQDPDRTLRDISRIVVHVSFCAVAIWGFLKR